MKIVLLILLLGITVNLSAQDERWVFYGAIWNGDEYFYDKESIKYNTSSIEVWVKLVFKTYFYDSYQNKYEQKRILHLVVQCEDRKYKTIEYVQYYTDGTERYIDDYYEDFNTIIPESETESLYYKICK